MFIVPMKIHQIAVHSCTHTIAVFEFRAVLIFKVFCDLCPFGLALHHLYQCQLDQNIVAMRVHKRVLFKSGVKVYHKFIINFMLPYKS